MTCVTADVTSRGSRQCVVCQSRRRGAGSSVTGLQAALGWQMADGRSLFDFGSSWQAMRGHAWPCRRCTGRGLARTYVPGPACCPAQPSPAQATPCSGQTGLPKCVPEGNAPRSSAPAPQRSSPAPGSLGKAGELAAEQPLPLPLQRSSRFAAGRGAAGRGGAASVVVGRFGTAWYFPLSTPGQQVLLQARFIHAGRAVGRGGAVWYSQEGRVTRPAAKRSRGPQV